MRALAALLAVVFLGASEDPCRAVMDQVSSTRRACIAEELAKLGDRSLSMAAVQLLSGLAPDSIKDLREALKHGETELTRASAADALGRIGSAYREIEDAVPDLVAGLKDASVLVRRQCATALGRIGRRAVAALPALRARLQDLDQVVRYAAKVAIDAIETESKR
jgi:HEAT repeat protein